MKAASATNSSPLNISTGMVVTSFLLLVKRLDKPPHLGLSIRALQVRLWQLGA